MMKKLLAVFMTLVLVSGTISLSAQDFDPDDGHIVDNPWADLFVGTKLPFDVEDSYLQGWNGSAATMEAEENNSTVSITTTGKSEGDNTMWAIQTKSVKVKVIVGELYKYTVTLVSDKDKEVVIKASSTDGLNTDYGTIRVSLKANEAKQVSLDNIAPTKNEMQIVTGLGTMGEEAPTTNFTVQMKNAYLEGKFPAEEETSEEESSTEEESSEQSSKDPSEEESSSEQSSDNPATEKPSETTSKAEVTTKSETTTKAEVTTKSETTTKAEVITKCDNQKRLEEFKKSGKAKVKVATKKKSAKKVKVTLKKALKVSDGYQVRFYKTKKNAKKNKKAVAKVTYKKNKKAFTVSGKKLKNKKTLYIRVRGYLKLGKKTYYGKWSVTKKVKIKK